MSSEEDKTPLKNGGDTPDYNAIFGEKKKDKFSQQTVLGEVRNVKRFTWVEWVFVVVVTLSLLVVLALTIERFVFFESTFVNITIDTTNGTELSDCNQWTCTNDVVFAVVVLINLFFCACYCYSGLLRERSFEMIGYAVAVLVIILYIIANYAVKGEEGQPIRLARLVLVCVFGPVNIVLALIIWWRMGYLTFTTIGTNKTLVWAYRFRSFFLTLQLFNILALVNILVLAFSRNGHFITLGEKVVLPILFVYSLLTSVLGAIAVFYEVRVIAIVWYFLITPFAGYYVYKLINVSMDWSEYAKEYTVHYNFGSTNTHYLYIGAAILVATIVGMVLFILMWVFMLLSHRNFGKGLKDKIKPPLEGVWNRCAWWCMVKLAKRKMSSPLA